MSERFCRRGRVLMEGLLGWQLRQIQVGLSDRLGDPPRTIFSAARSRWSFSVRTGRP